MEGGKKPCDFSVATHYSAHKTVDVLQICGMWAKQVHYRSPFGVRCLQEPKPYFDTTFSQTDNTVF